MMKTSVEIVLITFLNYALRCINIYICVYTIVSQTFICSINIIYLVFHLIQKWMQFVGKRVDPKQEVTLKIMYHMHSITLVRTKVTTNSNIQLSISLCHVIDIFIRVLSANATIVFLIEVL